MHVDGFKQLPHTHRSMLAFSFHLVVVFTTSIDGTVMEKREALICTQLTLKAVTILSNLGLSPDG